MTGKNISILTKYGDDVLIITNLMTIIFLDITVNYLGILQMI